MLVSKPLPGDHFPLSTLHVRLFVPGVPDRRPSGWIGAHVEGGEFSQTWKVGGRKFREVFVGR